MNIELKVVGSLALLARVRDEFRTNYATADFCPMQVQGMTVRVRHAARIEQAFDLLGDADTPAVVVVEIDDAPALERLSALHAQADALAQEREGAQLVSPVISILNTADPLQWRRGLSPWVSDVVFGNLRAGELAHRVLLAVRRRGVRVIKLLGGAMILLPESRSVACDGTVVRLSPTEFALAELFLNKLGSIVPLEHVRAAFETAGKSSEANNIRVAIFQLRLKLEEITKGSLQLITVYRRGYCLRQYAVAKPKQPSCLLSAPMRTRLELES